MTGPTDGQVWVYEQVQAGKSTRQIAQETGRARSTVWRQYDRARKWLDAPSALRDGAAAIGADTPGAVVWTKTNFKGETAYSVMHSGKEAPPSPEEYAEAVIARLSDIPPAPAVIQAHTPEKNIVNLFVTADWHLGASVTKSEVGRDYSRKIAVEMLREGFAACHAAQPPAETALVVFNGDTTDADNDKRETYRSGNKLMVEGSHQSNLLTAEENADWQIQMALEKHDQVIFAAKRGNHDPHTPPTLIAGMRGRYRENERVTVIEEEDPFFTFQKNRLFVCTHHGDGQKPEKMALAIPFKYRREWGRSDFHFLITSHLHHSKSDTFGGLRWYQTPSLCRIEQHGNHLGFADTGGMMSLSFDSVKGTVSDFTKRL